MTLKVLLVAEAANPQWVSVPLVGWSLAAALREVADVHIVTQIRNRDAFLRAGLRENEDFTAIDSEAAARLAWRAGSVLRAGKGKGWTAVTALSALAYPYFERLLWRRFGDEIHAGRFDLVHRVTPLSPTAASPIAPKLRAAGVPFVLGPLNGGVPWPPGFDVERRREREWLSYVRGAYKLLPGRAATLEAAAAILVGSRHTESEIPRHYRDKGIYLPENAIDPARFSAPPKTERSGPLRGCFVGRLVPYKGPHMLIEAAAPLMRSGRFKLDIVGDGPLRSELEARAAREGVSEAIIFHGQVPHREVQTVLREADLFVFPSVREFGGGAVLEAMALGVPPLVVDYAGPGELVERGLGFKIPIGRPDKIVARLRAELERHAAAPEALAETGRRARARVQEAHTWAARAVQILTVYDWVLGGGPKPEPFVA